MSLAIKRQLTNTPSTTATLNGAGHAYTNEQLAEEMRTQTKLGKQMFDADIDYLNSICPSSLLKLSKVRTNPD